MPSEQPSGRLELGEVAKCEVCLLKDVQRGIINWMMTDVLEFDEFEDLQTFRFIFQQHPHCIRCARCGHSDQMNLPFDFFMVFEEHGEIAVPRFVFSWL